MFKIKSSLKQDNDYVYKHYIKIVGLKFIDMDKKEVKQWYNNKGKRELGFKLDFLDDEKWISNDNQLLYQLKDIHKEPLQVIETNVCDDIIMVWYYDKFKITKQEEINKLLN